MSDLLPRVIDKTLAKRDNLPTSSSGTHNLPSTSTPQAVTSSAQSGTSDLAKFKSLTDEECVLALKTFFSSLKQSATNIRDMEYLLIQIISSRITEESFLSRCNAMAGSNHINHAIVADYIPFLERALPLLRISIKKKKHRFNAVNNSKAVMASCQKMQESIKDIEKHHAELLIANRDLSCQVNTLQKANGPGPPADGAGTSHTESREESLVLTFGIDESSLALRQFIDHYYMARDKNVENKVSGWCDPAFRAYRLCFQLRGEAASWVFKEMVLRQGSACHDDELIAILRERYLEDISIEEKIMKFEQLEQLEKEPLSTYMQRCQNHGQLAYAGFGENAMQERIIWKFIAGISNPYIRSVVMASKWMLHQSEAKPCSEILKLAELETIKLQYDRKLDSMHNAGVNSTKPESLKRSSSKSEGDDSSKKARTDIWQCAETSTGTEESETNGFNDIRFLDIPEP